MEGCDDGSAEERDRHADGADAAVVDGAGGERMLRDGEEEDV